MAAAHSRWRRFGADRSGATMIEFALLGIPFFAIVAAILETSMIFFASQVLDSAVHDSARLIRTGQAQNAGLDTAGYKRAICGGLYRLFDCNGLRVKVSVVGDFSAVARVAPVASGEDCSEQDCEWTVVEDFQPGAGSDVVMVEAYYRWPILINLPGLNLMNLPDGTRLLGAVRVFQNEPFS
ncbi:MAG: TadE/TadG family type IV pilus assembly protein [Devosia sp.]